MGHRTITAGMAVALLLTGCGPTGDPSSTTGDDGSAPVQGDEAETVDCGGSVYDATELADAPTAGSLPEGPAEAVDDVGAPAFDPSQDWRVVRETDSRVDLVRELEEPEDLGGGDVRTHESRSLERITGSSNVPDGTWLLTSAGPCTQRLVTDGDLGEADLTLAAAPPSDATTVELLVRERACASGQTAEGRIELAALEETADEVRLRIGVRPIQGDATCPENPPTPFTVELDEPLGDREIVDASVVPARPVPVDGGR